jgi:type VI secretion system secreted protein VgrG
VQESDLDFLRRLLAEEGLFTWFEHAPEDGATLGTHTLVLADHNGAFADNAQPTYRYTQPGATLDEDSLDRWRGERRLDSTEQRAGSWDYRSLPGRDQSEPPRVSWRHGGVSQAGMACSES